MYILSSWLACFLSGAPLSIFISIKACNYALDYIVKMLVGSRQCLLVVVTNKFFLCLIIRGVWKILHNFCLAQHNCDVCVVNFCRFLGPDESKWFVQLDPIVGVMNAPLELFGNSHLNHFENSMGANWNVQLVSVTLSRLFKWEWRQQQHHFLMYAAYVCG